MDGSSRVPLQSSYSRFAAPLSPIILLNFAVKWDHCLEYVNEGIFWRSLSASGENYFWINLTAVLSAMLSLHARGFLSLHCTSMRFCVPPALLLYNCVSTAESCRIFIIPFPIFDELGTPELSHVSDFFWETPRRWSFFLTSQRSIARSDRSQIETVYFLLEIFTIYCLQPYTTIVFTMNCVGTLRFVMQPYSQHFFIFHSYGQIAVCKIMSWGSSSHWVVSLVICEKYDR